MAEPSERHGKSNQAETPAEKNYVISCKPYYRPLLQATFRGDWEFAKRFFKEDSNSKMAEITHRSETVLHMAALSAQDQFFENLVELLSPYPEVLEMCDWDGRTALHNAVLCGRIRMVKALVRSNPTLTQLVDKEGRVPLEISAQEASMHKEIAWLLAQYTTDNGPAIATVINLIHNGHPDIALSLVRPYPHLIIKKTGEDDKNDDAYHSILNALMVRESNFPSGTKLNVMETLIYKCIPVDLNPKPTDENSDPALQCLTRSLWNATKIIVPIIKRIHEVKLRHVAAMELAKQVCIAISHWESSEITEFFGGHYPLWEATVRGISEIVKLLIQFFPEVICYSPDGGRLPTRAVKHRQERTLRLFLKVSSVNKLSLVPGPTEDESNKMLAAVAEYDSSDYYPSFNVVTDVAGAAFQMQRELQWYKAVESWSIPGLSSNYSEEKSTTYWNDFVKAHKKLRSGGERWMRDTADKCMLISTLIATVLFAAAFTVPGGNDDDTGVPLLLGQDSLLVFALSDALGLFSSVTAILLFLAILTSRYEVQDFLYSLPTKIILGLSFLFLSLAFMLVAFTATLTIVLNKRLEWVVIPIALLASFPMALFILLQLPLLHQMVKSTYGPSIFHPESN